MTERAADPRKLDVRRFARAGALLQGAWPQAQCTRLAASLLPPLADEPAPPVQWQAHGALRLVKGGEAEIWLHLQADAVVRLECQRCLQPMTGPLRLNRQLRFVTGDDEAARLDEDNEDDVLALSDRLDLMDLLEDELILALPLVPRHEICAQPLHGAPANEKAAADEPRLHPFAALATLRGKPPST